jgi:hypothetical protein
VQPNGSDDNIVLTIIRGQQPIAALATAGVTMSFRAADPEGKSRQIIITQDRPFGVQATVADIAAGLIRHISNPDELSDWATFLLAADWIDFEPLERHPDGDILLEALWNASFRYEIGGTAIETATRLAAA